MKLGSLTKLDKRNKTTSNNNNNNNNNNADEAVSEHCEVIAIFSIYGQFVAIRKLDFI